MNSNTISQNDSCKYFYEKANEHLNSLNIKFRNKAVITQNTYEKIIQCLSNKNINQFNSRFITWCTTSFILQPIGSKILICDIQNKRPILTYENMYNIYKQVHTETAHGGRDKCLDQLSLNYSWYNRQLLQIFIKNCTACQKRKPLQKPMLSKPIIALEFMTRVQMDLIDMRTRPDSNSDGKLYRWILQLKDHFTKFCWAKPLEHKTSQDVHHHVREIFFMFGAPHILQSDNGREFANDLINNLQIDFPGLHIVHGRPRHPQSQGLIERANAILTDALGKWMEDNETNHWADGLASVIFSINTRTTHTTKKSPYQLVFGQHPKTNTHYWGSIHDAALANDIQMDDLIIDKLTPSNDEQISDESEPSITTNSSDTESQTFCELIKEIDNNIQESISNLNDSNIINNFQSRHEIFRTNARINYLKSQNKRQKIYDEHLQKIANSYKNDDLVGISIDKVDRTNCDPKIMPCIIEKRSNDTNVPTYHLISPYGRISTSFPVHQLIPMSGIKPTSLQNINFESLPTVTLIQASKLFARGNASATCDCKSKCKTKTCPCRRISIACSTKCHARLGKCRNV